MNASGNSLAPQLGRDSEMPGSPQSTSLNTNFDNVYSAPSIRRSSSTTTFGRPRQQRSALSPHSEQGPGSLGGSMDLNPLSLPIGESGLGSSPGPGPFSDVGPPSSDYDHDGGSFNHISS